MITEEQYEPSSLLKRLSDSLFGYDYFISYAWEDGRNYAIELSEKLEKQGFDCFLDSENYVKGDDWKKIGFWTLKRTGHLLLVVSNTALSSQAVEHEVQIFCKTGRRIIPIEFDQSICLAESDSNLLNYLPPEILTIKELKSIEAGLSNQALEQIVESFSLVRQSQKRIRILSFSVLLFIGLAIVASTLGYFTKLTNEKLIYEKNMSHANLLFLNAERKSKGHDADLILSTQLALESYRRHPNSDALNLLRKRLPKQAYYQSSISLPWTHGNTNKVILSRDSQFALNYSLFLKDGELRVYNTRSGKLAYRIKSEYSIKCAELSPDNHYLAFCTKVKRKGKWVKQLQVFDIQKSTKTPIYTRDVNWGIHSSGHTNIRFNSNNSTLAIVENVIVNGKSNYKVIIVNVSDGNVESKKDFGFRFKLRDFSGEYLLVSHKKSKHSYISFYNWRSTKNIHTLKFKRDIRAAKIYKKNSLVAIASGRKVYVYRLLHNKTRRLGVFDIPSLILGLKFHPNGDQLMVRSYPNGINVFNFKNRKETTRIQSHRKNIGSMGWLLSSNEGFEDIVIANHREGPLYIDSWLPSNSLELNKRLSGKIEPPLYSGLPIYLHSKNNDRVYALIYDKEKNLRKANVFELKGNRYELFVSKIVKGFGATMSPKGKYLAVDDNDGKFSVYNLNNNTLMFNGQYGEGEHDLLEYIRFDQNEEYLVTSSEEFKLNDDNPPHATRVWKIKSGRMISSMPTGRNGISVKHALSNQKNLLAIASNFGLSLWDIINGKKLYEIRADLIAGLNGDNFWNVKFSADQEFLANETVRNQKGRKVEIRRARTGEVLYTIPFSSNVVKLEYESSGKYFTVALDDGTIHLYDAKTYEFIGKINHGDSVIDFKFNAAATKLASLDRTSNGKLKVWRLDNFSLVNEYSTLKYYDTVNWSRDELSLLLQSKLRLLRIMIDDLAIIAASEKTLIENISLENWLKFFPGEPYRKKMPDKPIAQISGNLTAEDQVLLLSGFDFSNEPKFNAQLLYWAAKNNRDDLVTLMTKNRANFNISDNNIEPNGLSPLAYSARLGMYKVFSSLLDGGAKWSFGDDVYKTPLYLVLHSQTKYKDSRKEKILKRLILEKAHIDFLSLDKPNLHDEQELLRKTLKNLH